MGIWNRFLDWILGADLISLDDLRTLEDKAIERLREEFEQINNTIDTDGNGNVSVREAWSLIKGIFSVVKQFFKGLIS